MTISTASRKQKARLHQQSVQGRILKLDEKLTEEDVRSAPMGVPGEDLQLSPRAREVFPFNVECKRRKAFAFYKDMEQAEGHGPHTPLLFMRADRKKGVVMMYEEDFFKLIGEQNG
jgi:hypothetical protein